MAQLRVSAFSGETRDVGQSRRGRRALSIMTVTSILAIVLSAVGAAQLVFAAEFDGGRWLSRDVTYYNATITPYSTAFNAGKNQWSGVSDLNFFGADTSNANIRVSTLSQTSSAAGITYTTTNGFGFFVNQTRVYFNTYVAGSQSANCKRMIITHELGHAAGLGHREGAFVMRSTTVDCETRFNPQPGDISSMNTHY